MSFISERSATVAPFRVMKILGAAHKRDDALVLCVGQPATSASTRNVGARNSQADFKRSDCRSEPVPDAVTGL